MRNIAVTIHISATGRSALRNELAVAEIRVLDKSISSPTEKKSITVSIGARSASEPLMLIPGQYMAHARLPSGEQIAEQFVVQTDPAKQKITLGRPDRLESPKRTGLRVTPPIQWHPVPDTGAIPSADKPFSLDFLSQGFSLVYKVPDRGPAIHHRSASRDAGPHMSGPRQKQSLTRVRIHDTAARKPLLDVLRESSIAGEGSSDFDIILGQGTADKLLAKFESNGGLLFQRQTATLLDSLGVETYSANVKVVADTSRSSSIRIPTNARNWVNEARYVIFRPSDSAFPVPAKQRTKIARIPGPWRIGNKNELADVLVDTRRAARHQDTQVHLSIDDPSMQTVLGFTQQKDLNGALTVLEQSVDLLMHKIENPYAAAAAGYVLLLAPPERIQPFWHTWIGNLGAWFSDLPDGNILHATLLLQSETHRNGDDDHDRYFPVDEHMRSAYAAELILEGLRRGIPLYRAGLGLLASNLRILNCDERLSRAVQARLQHAERVVYALRSRADTSQAFTVLDVTGLY